MNQANLTVSLRIKLFVAFAVVALIPLLLLAVINGRNTRRVLVENASHALFVTSNDVANTLDEFIDTNLAELTLESRLPVVQAYFGLIPEQRLGSLEEANILTFLNALTGKSEHVRSYGLLDPNGFNLLDTHPAYQSQSEAERDYYTHFQSIQTDPQAFVSTIQFRPDISSALLFFSIPIFNETGDILGYLRAEYDAAVLQELLVEQNNLAGTGSFGVLFDEYFIHLAHGIEPSVNFIPIVRFSPEIDASLRTSWRLPDLPDAELYPMQLDELEAGLSQAPENPFFEATDVATGDAINQVAVASMRTQPWSVAFFQPQELFLAPVEAQVRQTALLVAVIAGISVLAAYLFGGVLIRPLTSLIDTVTAFAEGNLLARSTVRTHDEIGLLAGHFNEMAERVGALLTGLESRTEALQQVVEKHEQTEIKLRQQRRFLRQVTNINPSFIFAKDRDGRFVMVNQGFADTYNTTIENMLGKTDADFNPDPVKVAQFRRDDLQVFASGQELFIPEQRTVNSFGEIKWWQTIKRPLRVEDGTVTEVLTVVTEITERKQNEEAMLIARDRALEASRLKSEILSKANHELQTPLGAILGYAEMMETGYFGEVTEEQQGILRKIIIRTNDLTSLIQNLLDQANMEASNFSHIQDAFLPKDLLKQVHDDMAAKAEQKGLAFTSEIDEDFPGILIGDPTRLHQILTNLVSNGLKFTEEGQVHIQIYRPDEATWAIAVSDTGPGIPEEAHSYIFKPFRQVDGSITRKHQGFGLGLSLVKELALSMEGDIQLTSRVGEGSTFTVIFPYTPVMEAVS